MKTNPLLQPHVSHQPYERTRISSVPLDSAKVKATAGLGLIPSRGGALSQQSHDLSQSDMWWFNSSFIVQIKRFVPVSTTATYQSQNQK